ncbi:MULTISPECIES: transcription repressor NadR [Caldisericum]|jgi:transcriptional regulator of NAD metabolism|uniref:Transcription repressor NadR n=2 Tax=Caldisericum exile TaxID=693075 RepID=A0A2J6WFP1_9BACT|nr:MAG: transcription repressor NadR [Caldisericum exile]
MKEKEGRIKEILKLLEDNVPISGTVLANKLGVTRQIIVQDIAVLKSRGYNIISTARGYILNSKTPKFVRLVAVKHEKSDIRKELEIIVSNGGEVLDVIVEHPVYGEIKGYLNLKTLDDVKAFITAMETSHAEPLLTLSHGIHLHHIGGESEEILDRIEQKLKEEGILL